jgi:hypothetical protein
LTATVTGYVLDYQRTVFTLPARARGFSLHTIIQAGCVVSQHTLLFNWYRTQGGRIVKVTV